MHLSYNNCFTSNSFCLRLVFVASRGIIPLTIIWRCFNRFWKSKQRDTNKSVGYFARLSVSRLSVHSLLPHTWVTGRRTVRSGFYRHLRHLCRNFRPRHFYISLSLQQWSLLWQQSMYCFLLSGVLHVYYVYSATRFCKIFQLTVFFVSHQSSTTKTPFTHFISLQKSVLFYLCMLNWHCRFTSALEESVPSLTHCCCL